MPHQNAVVAAPRQSRTPPRLIPAAGEGDDLALRRERARATTIRDFWLAAGFAPPSLPIEFYRGRRGRSPIYGIRSDNGRRTAATYNIRNTSAGRLEMTADIG
jgi:hypothetical protein